MKVNNIKETHAFMGEISKSIVVLFVSLDKGDAPIQVRKAAAHIAKFAFEKYKAKDSEIGSIVFNYKDIDIDEKMRYANILFSDEYGFEIESVSETEFLAIQSKNANKLQ